MHGNWTKHRDNRESVREHEHQAQAENEQKDKMEIIKFDLETNCRIPT